MQADILHRWEQWPVGALVAAAGLNTAVWYVGVPLAGYLPQATQVMLTLAAVASVIAIDGALIATIAGMREGRRSRWSTANIVVCAVFTGLAALSAHGVLPGVGSWLHGLFALTIVTYAMHLSQPRADVTIALASREQEVTRREADVTRRTAAIERQVPVKLTPKLLDAPPDDRKATVKRLVSGGMTRTEAARQVGVTRQTVSEWMKGE